MSSLFTIYEEDLDEANAPHAAHHHVPQRRKRRQQRVTMPWDSPAAETNSGTTDAVRVKRQRTVLTNIPTNSSNDVRSAPSSSNHSVFAQPMTLDTRVPTVPQDEGHTSNVPTMTEPVEKEEKEEEEKEEEKIRLNNLRSQLIQSGKMMIALANEIGHRPFLVNIASDLSFRVAQEVTLSLELFQRSRLSSSAASPSPSKAFWRLLCHTSIPRFSGWNMILAYLPVADGASLGTTCDTLGSIFQSPATWSFLLRHHFLCDLDPATTAVPKQILRHRKETFLKPLYQVLLKDMKSEKHHHHTSKAHPLDRACYYLNDCPIWGRTRADCFFRRVVHDVSLVVHQGELCADYAEWLGYQKRNCQQAASAWFDRAVHLCQEHVHTAGFSSLPLVLSARANFTLNTLSSLIGSEAELLQQRIVMRSAAEVDILRAASILYEVVAGQKNMVPKNGEDDIIRLDTPRTTENKRKLERAACSVVALLIRIGRHDDASALMSSSVGSLKHTVAVDAEDRATHLTNVFNQVLLRCWMNDFDGALVLLVDANAKLAVPNNVGTLLEMPTSSHHEQFLVLQGLYMTLVLGSRQAKYLLAPTALAHRTMARTMAQSFAANVARDSIVGLVARLTGGKRIGKHQQWRMSMVLKLSFEIKSNDSAGGEAKRPTKTEKLFKKRFLLLRQMFMGVLPTDGLDGWSVWSKAMGVEIDHSDDCSSTSSDTSDDDSNDLDGSGGSSTSRTRESWSAVPRSYDGSAYTLSLRHPTSSCYVYSIHDPNVWGF